ncbi:uncharacterized protein LOC108677896 [Hyalella azteca]|uniref:Uncharacterized protein LOC108677896 n=1 Tax=Hyalella azteca TaxID=294128 RepID=A0A8B7P6A3_HYAAZ|nr:uncharacterized protein LOC108677896 [Hyalella azteca]XP_047736751.1 uncharacterized protein LOC108677896 [Hyalella azteca]
MVKHLEAETLNGVRYGNLDEISRCMHLSDFTRCYRKSTLIPHRLGSKVVDTDSVDSVLWFAPALPPEEHNMYGNVSFTISMCELNARFSFNFYYIDRIEFATHTSTRVLFTEHDYDNVFEVVDFKEYGSPLKRSRWRHAIQCESGHSYEHDHRVEIAIEADKENRDWLFRNCKLIANNHSSANTPTHSKKRPYEKSYCHRHNFFGDHCPSDFSTKQTRKLVLSQYKKKYIF